MRRSLLVFAFVFVSSHAKSQNIESLFLKYSKNHLTPENVDQVFGHRTPTLLFVSGLFQNQVESISRNVFGQQHYAFDDFVQYAALLGIKSKTVRTNTIGSMYDNARIIRDLIATTPSNIVIVCHSKGCIDTLAFVLNDRFDSHLSKKVSGVVALAAPFFGSELADHSLQLVDNDLGLDGIIMEYLGGSMITIQEITVRYRMQYMRKNADAILKLQSKIPFLSVASNLLPSSRDQASRFTYLSTFIRDHFRKDNDGLVPVKSAILPGSCFTILMNVEHNEFLYSNSVLPVESALSAYLQTLLKCSKRT